MLSPRDFKNLIILLYNIWSNGRYIYLDILFNLWIHICMERRNIEDEILKYYDMNNVDYTYL